MTACTEPGAIQARCLVNTGGARRAQVPARQDDAADGVDPHLRGADVFEQMQRQLDAPLH